jgi:tape measure domain-containing protein
MVDRTVKVTLSAQVNDYIQGMDRAAKATRDTGSEADNLTQKREAFGLLGGTLLAVGAAVTAVGVAALKTGIDYNTLQQTSRAALTTLLGSAEAAADQMDRLDDFARTSPFSKAVFISAQQQMLAFGIETKKVIPYLDAIQNAVAASGGTNDDLKGIVATMSKIQSASKLTATDLMEFGNRGINAAELIGSQMGKTGAQIRTEITAGSLDATVALDALTAGMSEKFEGASANVKETFVGAMDRLSAAWRDFSSELATPLVDPNGGGALVDLLNWASDAMRAFEKMPEPVKLATTAIVGVAGAAALIGGTMLVALPKIAEYRSALAALDPTGTKVSGAMKGVGVAVAALVALQLAHAARGWADDLTGATIAADKYRIAVKQGADSTKLIDDAIRGGGAAFGLMASDVRNLNLLLTDAGKVSAEFQNSWLGTLAEFSTLGGADTSLGATSKNLKEIDSAMAQLTASGNADAALTMWDQLVSKTDGSKESIDALRKVFPQYTEAQLDAVDATEDHADALAGLQGAADSGRESVDKMADAIRGFGSLTLDAREAERKFQAAIDEATDSVIENGATLDLNTEQGRANEASLDALAEAALNRSAALLEETGDQEGATAAVAAGREALINQLAQYGITGAEAEAYADKLGLIPANVDTAVNIYTSDAQRRLDAIRNTLDQISARGLTLGAPGTYGSNNENGGMWNKGIREFANGGFPSGVYAGGQNIHKFAETGLAWETYISPKPGREKENIGYALESLSRLGYDGYSQGGRSGPVAGSSSRTEINMNVTGDEPRTAAEMVYQRLDAALALQK